MAGVFDAIPILTVTLFALGIVGIMVYEKTRSKSVEESKS
jgi:hypothetical protein